MNARTEFGRVVRVVREALGYSQSDLAAAVGVSQSLVSRWEAGERLPDVLEWDAIKALPPRLNPDVNLVTADALTTAWGVIANVSDGDWSKQSPEWREAAIRFAEQHGFRTPEGAR